jgi:hypothetical protein
MNATNNSTKEITFQKEEPRLTPGTNPRWVFVDLEDFEFNVRQDERRKFFELRKRERARRRWTQEAQNDILKATIRPRLLGLIVVLMSICSFVGTGGGDGTWLMVTVPIGLLLMIMPGSNKPKR